MDALIVKPEGEVFTASNGKAAGGDSGVMELVTFTLGDEEYAVNILKVQEINRMREITRVPKSPYYVEGVINLRGKVMPVVNLRKKLGMPDRDHDSRSRIMITDIYGVTMGLIVDSVLEVLRIPAGIVDPAPAMASDASSEYINGIAKLQDRLIALLNMDRLLGGAAGDIAEISAA